jgi:nitrile hydratase
MSIARKPPKPRFKRGDRVTIDDRRAIGHCRTPWYLRGKAGVIAGVQGAYHDPERLAYHKPGWPVQVLYKVRFLQAEVWPRYPGPAGDHLEADIYEYWLRPAAKEGRP